MAALTSTRFASPSAPLMPTKMWLQRLHRLRQLMMRQGGRTILSVRWFPLGILALRNLGRSSGTALMKTMKATVKAGAVGPLRHNDEAFSSASTGRRTRAAQGSARQGVATAKAPDMEAGVTVVTGP
jgi:hypothetical protein